MVADVHVDLKSTVIVVLGNVMIFFSFVPRRRDGTSLVDIWLECIILFVSGVFILVLREVSSLTLVLVSTLHAKNSLRT